MPRLTYTKREMLKLIVKNITYCKKRIEGQRVVANEIIRELEAAEDSVGLRQAKRILKKVLDEG